MDSNELKQLLEITTKEFMSMSEEEHRKIQNNPSYDGLFHVIDDMTSLDNKGSN